MAARQTPMLHIAADGIRASLASSGHSHRLACTLRRAIAHLHAPTALLDVPNMLSVLLSGLALAQAALAANVNNLGNLAPYHKAPVPEGVNETLPEDCMLK